MGKSYNIAQVELVHSSHGQPNAEGPKIAEGQFINMTTIWEAVIIKITCKFHQDIECWLLMDLPTNYSLNFWFSQLFIMIQYPTTQLKWIASCYPIYFSWLFSAMCTEFCLGCSAIYYCSRCQIVITSLPLFTFGLIQIRNQITTLITVFAQISTSFIMLIAYKQSWLYSEGLL